MGDERDEIDEIDVQMVDINRSPVEALEHVPGIGPKLAQRILAARPFTSVEDLVRVNGIGPQTLERIRPYLTVSPLETVVEEESALSSEVGRSGDAPSEESSPVDAPASPAPLAEGEATIEEAAGGEAAPYTVGSAAEEKPAPEGVVKKPLTRRDFTTWMVVSNLITLFLALFLSLLFLWLVNGTLRFATISDFRQLRADAAVLAERLDRLQSNLDDLSTRVTSLQRDTTSLKSTLDAAQREVQALRTLIDGMDERLGAVEKSAQRFDRFLEGMRQLLTEVQSP